MDDDDALVASDDVLVASDVVESWIEGGVGLDLAVGVTDGGVAAFPFVARHECEQQYQAKK